jgi:uncharacterized membrane protein YdjX (TVP38/TMEM64 family)
MKTKIILILIAATAVGVFYALDVNRQLTLAGLKANRMAVQSFYNEQAITAVAGFILAYVVVAGLSLPGAAVLTLAGGAIFGAVPATLIVNVGATLGATLAFLAARFLLRDWVERTFGAKLQEFNTGFSRDALGYLLFLRLVPIFPFFLVNLVSGLTRIPLRIYFFGTMAGILPGTFVYANAGSNLASIDSLSDVASPGVLGAFALLGLFSLIPVAYKRWWNPERS